MYSVLGTRVGIEQPVGVHEKVVDVELRKRRLNAGKVTALGQPNARGSSPEDAFVSAHRHGELGIEAFFMYCQ